MRRPAALVLLACLLAPAGASAHVTRCSGTAPIDGGCTFTVTATTPHVWGMLASDLFIGVADYVIEGPSGRHAASCYAYPGVTTCVPNERGHFDPGDRITVTVAATGAGSWAFSLAH